MKQLLSDLRTGRVELVDVPRPMARPGHLLIATSRTLISLGTERMIVEFGQAGWIEKARRQPDKVRQVLNKVRTDGILPTMDAVFSKLSMPLPLGYSNCGTIMEVGAGVVGFAYGDQVVSNGPHAEVVCIPRNLCAKVPERVTDNEAAFTVLATVGLQGVRLAQPTLGETFGVIGLGLVGLMAAQILRASGCRVVGVDVSAERRSLAEASGIEVFVDASKEDPVVAAMGATGGRGVDGVLIAAATQSSDPVSQAARMCRKRGRIVLTGVSGLELSRADFYEKELSFQVSCSYGPGRYDPAYEEDGHDYPLGFVRWTEGRNFEAILDMMAAGRLDVRPLVGKVVPLEDAPALYVDLAGKGGGQGILIAFPQREHEVVNLSSRIVRTSKWGEEPAVAGKPAVAVVGAGKFALQVLIPAICATGARRVAVVSDKGVSAAHAAKAHGFARASADYREVLLDPAVNTVFLATRHDQHAIMAAEALEAGKHVFVEKPLALEDDGLNRVISAYEGRRATGPVHLMVGFNRRFAPHVRKIRELLSVLHEPKAFVMVVNAGAIHAGHWTQDPVVGGGRILGEACHFIDLLRHLADSPISDVRAVSMGSAPADGIRDDKVSITLCFADGSIGTVHYLANGHKSYPKERLEVFSGGRILVLDNFRRLTGYGWKGFREDRLWRQNKGHTAEVAEFLNAVEKGIPTPIPFGELVEVTRATIRAAGMIRTNN